MFNTRPSRRDFVTQLAGLAGASALAPGFAQAAGQLLPSDASRAPDDELDPWLKALKGRHRQLAHSHDKWTKGIDYAVRVKKAYLTEYGVPASEVDSILAAHGKTGAMTYVDAAWEKYGFGKMFDVKESAKSDKIATRNIFYAGTEDDPGIREALAAGVVVLSCRTALRGLSAEFAKEKKYGTAAEIERDLTGMLIPGVVLVPAMIIAIGRAQEQHCSYVYTG